MPHETTGIQASKSPHQPRWVHSDGQYRCELSPTRWSKQILSTSGSDTLVAAPRVDSALVKAVVRAHHWRQMIESGKYASSAELAKAEKVNDSYLSRILRLTLIAPDIIEAILAGRQPTTLQLDDLPQASAGGMETSTLRAAHPVSTSGNFATPEARIR